MPIDPQMLNDFAKYNKISAERDAKSKELAEVQARANELAMEIDGMNNQLDQIEVVNTKFLTKEAIVGVLNLGQGAIGK